MVDEEKIIAMLLTKIFSNSTITDDYDKHAYYDQLMERIAEQNLSIDEANYVIRAFMKYNRYANYGDKPNAIPFGHYLDLVDNGLVLSLKGY